MTYFLNFCFRYSRQRATKKTTLFQSENEPKNSSIFFKLFLSFRALKDEFTGHSSARLSVIRGEIRCISWKNISARFAYFYLSKRKNTFRTFVRNCLIVRRLNHGFSSPKAVSFFFWWHTTVLCMWRGGLLPDMNTYTLLGSVFILFQFTVRSQTI